ncbi:MAG TPA: hypothetical protein VEC37_09040 [Bacillota bacterium]|nr:hypothetical protein [Bacillota bacterium]
MKLGDFLFFLLFNLTVIAGLFYLQLHKIEKRLKRIRQEMQEMEDLVVAIIEEFEITTAPGDLKPEAEQIPLDFVPSPPSVESSVIESSPDLKKTKQLIFDLQITDPKHQKVIGLWQQGSGIAEIAQELAIGPGEVRFILSLYKQA